MKLFKQSPIVKYLIMVLLISFIANPLIAQTVEQGIKLIELEKFKEAKTNFESIVKSNPKKAADAYFYLGNLSILDSQYVEAQNYFTKGTEVDKDNPFNFVGLGHIKLLNKDTVAAQQIFEDALDMTDFKDVNVYIHIADAYVNSDVKSLSKPIEWLNKAKTLKEQKRNPLTYESFAKLYLKMNNGTLARENFQNAINYDIKFIKGYLGIADIYLKIKNYADAESNLNEALKIDSLYAITHKAFSDFYSTVKNYDKAANSYKKYIDYSERTEKKLSRYATLLYLAKDYKGAVAIILEIEKTNPNDEQLKHILAYSYYSLEEKDNGIPAFDKYFSLAKPEEYTSTDFAYYGKLQLLAGNDSIAAINYNKALKLDTSLTELHGELAVIYFKSKRYTDAAKEYELKEKQSGKKLSLREYFDYGRAFMLSKQYGKADSVFIKMIDSKPDLPIGYLWRARANASIDTTTELGLSKPHYEKFIELALKSTDQSKMKNDLIEAYRYLGYFYFIKREDPAFKEIWRENYKNYWEKVLELDPESQAAKDALDNLKKLK